QSYFLFATTKEQLDFLRFPLGHLKSKEETRALAARYGLQVADKPDSQDICFVPEGGYAKVIEKLRPGALEPGEVVDMEGNVLAKHDGIINFTVGQRKGLGFSSAEPMYVIRLNPEKHQVVVGPKEALLKQELYVRDLNWLDKSPPGARPVLARLRSMHAGVPAEIEMLANGRARVRLSEAQGAVTPGQACVIYDGPRLLGGGWIMGETNV
ncbi:MAG: tRNA 2-thiouridine(34) synthase MnmA, partial [Rickettsiales bacterium]|nr:tRNA 2-thiouridine(34) synthase MnmA [Rickettsiales bacterium]